MLLFSYKKRVYMNLESILISENIEEEIRYNEDYIFSLIPELKYEVGFEQKHPHHSFDVWNHTIEALKHSLQATLSRP